MTYKIQVTDGANPLGVIHEHHVNHNIEDIPEPLRTAVALLDAALEPPATRGGTFAVARLTGVGCKVFNFNAFEPNTYYVEKEYVDANRSEVG